MNVRTSWIIARKDLAVFRRRPSILAALLILPLGIGLGLPSILALEVQRGRGTFVSLVPLGDAFAFFFVIAAILVANVLASYSLAGEKVEKSLEPLLATPTTDGEILLGKVIGAFLPTIVAVYVGVVLFMAYFDALSRGSLGYLYYPNWSIAALLGVLLPLACLFSVECNVWVSARASDVRTAQQMGSLFVLPFAGLYVAGEVHAITLDTPTLLEVAAVLAVIDVALFFVSRATFQREQILTGWK